MKYIAGFLFFISISMLILLVYANAWGQSKCNTVKGNWIQINGGFHCVDKDFNEIEIYK
jgi:hypothetical protein